MKKALLCFACGALCLATIRSIGQIAGYYFHVVVLWVKLQATVLGVCWAIFLSL